MKPEFPRLFSLPFSMAAVKIAAFTNPLGFCFVAIETGAGSWGVEMCMSASPGEGGCLGVVGCGWEQLKMAIPGSAHGGPALLRAFSSDSCDLAWCTLGEQAPFWSCGAPWHASNPLVEHLEALDPPSAKAAGPWRQGSVTSSWLFLTLCPRQVFLWEPGRTVLGAKAPCDVAVTLSLLLKGWG